MICIGHQTADVMAAAQCYASNVKAERQPQSAAIDAVDILTLSADKNLSNKCRTCF